MKPQWARQRYIEFGLFAPAQFARRDLFQMSDNAESKGEAKKMVKNNATIWIDRVREVPTDRTTTIFDRLRRTTADPIPVEAGDKLIFGKNTYDGNRLVFMSATMQTHNDWVAKVLDYDRSK